MPKKVERRRSDRLKSREKRHTLPCAHARTWEANAVEPRYNEPLYNEPLYNEVLGITSNFLFPGNEPSLQRTLTRFASPLTLRYKEVPLYLALGKKVSPALNL